MNINNIVAGVLSVSSMVCVLTLVLEPLKIAEAMTVVGIGIIMALSAIVMQLYNLNSDK